MDAPRVYCGQSLLLRTTAAGIVLPSGYEIAVEDEDGSASRLIFWDQAMAFGKPALADSVVIVKEPVLSEYPSGRGITIGSPTDFEAIEEADPRAGKWHVPVSPEELARQGEEEVRARHFSRALRLLNLAEAGGCDVALAKADALLGMNRLSEARVLLKNPEKFAECSYRLGDFEMAKSMYQRLKNASDISRCDARIRETKGVYNWTPLFDAPIGGEVDIAEFRGAIEVRSSSTAGGRGVFAVRDLEEGELLVVEKAFAFTPIDVEKRLICVPSGKSFVYSSAALAEETMRQLRRYPHRHEELNSLLSASGTTAPPPGIVDSSHICGIMPWNAWFTPKNQAYGGLWLFTSRFNHSCSPNAETRILGRVMVIRTMRRVSAGEEVTVCYTIHRGDLSRRRAELLQHYGFLCDCDLCQRQRDYNGPKVLEGESNLERNVELVLSDSFVVSDLVQMAHLRDELRRDRRLKEALDISLKMGQYIYNWVDRMGVLVVDFTWTRPESPERYGVLKELQKIAKICGATVGVMDRWYRRWLAEEGETLPAVSPEVHYWLAQMS